MWVLCMVSQGTFKEDRAKDSDTNNENKNGHADPQRERSAELNLERSWRWEIEKPGILMKNSGLKDSMNV